MRYNPRGSGGMRVSEILLLLLLLLVLLLVLEIEIVIVIGFCLSLFFEEPIAITAALSTSTRA